MAIPKWVQLYKDKSLGGDSGTETFPIKRTDQILEMILKVRSKNGATRNSADAAAQQTVESSITKLQVNSGSAIFKSYTAEMCRKVATYRNGKTPAALITQKEGGTWAGNEDVLLGWQEYVMPINFNLPYDPYGNRTGVMLPAPLYDSLDLVMDYNFTISATAGFVTGGANHVFDLYALVMPKEAPGLMQNKRILVEAKKHDYTTVASGDEPFKLTLDQNRMLRQLFVQCYEAGVGEGVDITDLVFKADNDVQWASKWGDIQAKNAEDIKLVPRIQDWYLEASSADDEIWTRVPAAKPVVHPVSQITTVPRVTTVGDKITVTANAASDNGHLSVFSDVIPAVAVIDLDQDENLLNLQPQSVKDLEIILTQGGADGSVQILEQSIAKPWGY